MELLKAEIERKRKLLLEKNLITSSRKYFKRSDLFEQNSDTQKDTVNPLSVENKVGVFEKDATDASVDAHTVLPRPEVILRLRERSEPILLFGESEQDAFKRLRQCELQEPETNKGFRNDFQEAMEQVDQAYLDELLTAPGDSKNNAKQDEVEKNVASSYEDLRNLAEKMGKHNREHDMTVIVHFIQHMLHMWREQLQARSVEEKQSTKGKLAGATYRQTQEYLKPLLRKLKTFTLPEDISDSLTEIIVHLLNRNYLRASDAYLQMAIGNAPWPIGVTMVGIHARTGREKIFSKNVAHVMNDETQRKYIQALKRLMTKCQEYYPTDPSRCVEYQAFGPPQTSNRALKD